MLTLSSDHTEAVEVEEEQETPILRPEAALPRSNSWRLSSCEGAEDR